MFFKKKSLEVPLISNKAINTKDDQLTLSPTNAAGAAGTTTTVSLQEKTVTKTERIVIVAEGGLNKHAKYVLTELVPRMERDNAMITATADVLMGLGINDENSNGNDDSNSNNNNNNNNDNNNNYLPGSILHHDSVADYPAVMLSLPQTSHPVSSFVYGLAIGQLSVIIVMVIFIRFFIFAGLPQDKRDYQSHIRQQRQAKLLPDKAATNNIILEKTYYDVNFHPSESLNWFTVLVAQAIAYLREDAKQDNNLLHKISTVLNSDQIPNYIDKIDVTELNIGNDFPIFSNCRVVSKAKKGTDDSALVGVGAGGGSEARQRSERLLAERGSNATANGATASENINNTNSKFPKDEANGATELEDDDMILEVLLDIDLSDCITLGLDTNILLNYPRTLFAFLPVSLKVSVTKFSGTLQVALRQPKLASSSADGNIPAASNSMDRPRANVESASAVAAAAGIMNKSSMSQLHTENMNDPRNSDSSDDEDDEYDGPLYSGDEDSRDNNVIPASNGKMRRHAPSFSAAAAAAANTNVNNNTNSIATSTSIPNISDFSSKQPDENTLRQQQQQQQSKQKPKPNKSHRPYITLSFFEFPSVEFDIESSIGSRSKLTNVPKISRLVEAQLKKAIEKFLVYPNENKVYLPEVWPNPNPATSSSSSNPVNASSFDKNKASKNGVNNGGVVTSAGAGTYQQSETDDRPDSSDTGFGSVAGNRDSFDADLIMSTPGMSNASGPGGTLMNDGNMELSTPGSNIYDNNNNNNNNNSSNQHFGHATPRLHPRSFSSVSQLASNTASNLPNFRGLSTENLDDHVAVV